MDVERKNSYIFKWEKKGKMNWSLKANSTVSQKDLRLDNNQVRRGYLKEDYPCEVLGKLKY